MPIAYIGVGANTGDRCGNFKTARFLIEKKGAVVKRVSPLYETEALRRAGQPPMPPFINGVFEVETELPAVGLLEALEDVERTMGRSHKGNWRPRPIDLDILLYGDEIVKTERLTIPHKEMAKRWFVLKPLSDLAPDLVHPALKKTVKEILCNFSSIPPT